MCKPISEGGVRCAAHTRPGWEKVLADHSAFLTSPKTYDRLVFETSDAGQAVEKAVAEFASTPQGHKELTAWCEEIKADKATRFNQFAMFVKRSITKGEALAQANKEATAAIRKEQASEKRRANNSMSNLREYPNIAEQDSLAGRFPEIAAMWNKDGNNGFDPRYVAGKANSEVELICPEGHKFTGRLNNLSNAYERTGRLPSCPECQPRRRAAFRRTQEHLSDLVAAMDGDPKAFDEFSPALRASLLQRYGILGSGATEMDKEIGMNIVHQDITLSDAVKAAEYDKLDGKLRRVADEDDELSTPPSLDGCSEDQREESTRTRVAQVMKSVGVLKAAEDDPELAEHIMRESVEAMWEEAYRNPGDIDDLKALVNKHRDRSDYAAKVADAFTSELDRVQNMPLPDDYRTDRPGKDGTVQVIDPNLSQRRFMAMVEDRRTVANWSGTGAGKTLSATLAVQATGAREAIVIAPNSTVEQWADSYASAFPHTTDVRIGLPTGNEDPPTPGVTRVWVANYEKFQTNTAEVEQRLAPLAGRVDAIVFDEIHMAKVADESTRSQRRDVLERFRDTAGTANPDLVVVGMSATPVVNNLNEAQSALRLIQGEDADRFPTKPTIRNILSAHHAVAAAGVRHKPNYTAQMNREDITVDITAHVGEVQEYIKRNRKDGQPMHPALMEQALLKHKMPAIVAAVKKADGPSVVYTQYKREMVAPIKQQLEAEGLRVRAYTGDETTAERAEIVKSFQRGEVDVIVGNTPISTGVDGLQSVSNNLVVASMPWTSTEDEQLVGRLHRQGQARDVNVTYVLTEAKVGKLRWSWCHDNRRKRVLFKRSMADAVVDGVMPDGTLEGLDKGAEKSAGILSELVAATAPGSAA